MSKPEFILRETPAWLATHQDWISDGARKLYTAMRALMDQKTGRLFVPGRGWIKIRTIEQKAGMRKEARLKYMRELKSLGGVQTHRDHVIRTIDGRLRKVWGPAQFTVLRITRPRRNPHKHRGSTTDCFENILLRTDSSTVEEPVRHFLSETTNGEGRGVGGGFDSEKVLNAHTSFSHHHQSSAQLDDDDDSQESVCSSENQNQNPNSNARAEKQNPPFRENTRGDESQLTPEQVDCERYNEKIDRLIQKVIALPKHKGFDPDFLRFALDRIADRAAESRTRVASQKYFEKSLDNLIRSGPEYNEWWDEWYAKRERRKRFGFAPDGTPPPESELLKEAFERATREDRPVIEVLQEMKAQKKDVGN